MSKELETIADTRAEMSATINQIEERLSPSHLREQIMEQLDKARGTLRVQIHEEIQELQGTVKASVKEEIQDIKQILKAELDDAKSAVRAATIGKVETMVQNVSNTVSDARSSIVNTIRENPIPVALIGVGVVWLLMNGTNTGRRTRAATGDAAIKVREVSAAAAGAASTFAHDASDKLTNLAHRAADTAGSLATQTKEGAYAAEKRVERAMHDNPLAVGAAVFALGTAIGLAIPSTQREDALMGSARDNLLGKAEHAAQGALHTAQETLSSALSGNGKRGDNGGAALGQTT